MRKCIAFIIFLVFSSFAFWWIAVPESLIEKLIVNSLGNKEIYLATEGFTKGLFNSFKAEKIILKKRASDNNSDISFLIFDDVHARIGFASLLKLSPELDFDCMMNNGEITGSLKLTGKHRFSLNGKNIQANGLPILEMLGVKGDGNLFCELFFDDGKGEVKFSLNDAKLKSGLISDIIFPLNMFSDIRGALEIDRQYLKVKSFAMDGSGIYARVTGDVQKEKTNLKMEIMIDSSFEKGEIAQKIFEQYMVSTGHYVMPLKDSLFSKILP